MIPRLLRFFRREVPGPKGLVLAVSPVSAIAQGLLLSTLNAAVARRDPSAGPGRTLAIFVLLLAVYLGTSYFTMYKATEMAGRMAHALRLRLCRKLAGSELRVVEHYGRGEIYAHITRDIDRLTSTALNLPGTIHSALLLIFCIAYIGWHSLVGMAAMLLALMLGVGTYMVQERRANANLRVAWSEEAAFFEMVDDELGGFKELKLHEGRRARLLEAMEAVSERFRLHYARTKLLFFFSFLCSHSFLYGAIALIAILPPEWLAGDAGSNFKMLTAILFSIDPIRSVVEFIEPANHAAVALDQLGRLETLLDRAAEPPAVEAALRRAPPAIALDGVGLRYVDPRHGTEFPVGPLDLELPPGSVTFVVGGNGSGKTSLLKLLTALYAPDQGRILVDGRPVEAARRADYRQLFAAIFADFHLFRRLYGQEATPPAAIDPLLARFGLSDKTGFAAGAFTNPDLSTGQRKRLALIALLLEEKPVLVLDEFAADQDPAFRTFFYRTLLPELRAQGRTIVAATHDDAYFDCCDQLVKMDMGRILSVRRREEDPEYRQQKGKADINS
jgi:putative ATP-binding cassette transporter